MAPRAKSKAQSDEVEIGLVNGVFGVHGEVRLFLHNRDSRWLFRARKVTLVGPKGQRRSVSLRAREGAGRRVLGFISEVSNPEQAAGLKDWKILVPISSLPKPDPDEFYISQVEGMEVWVAGRRVGVVRHVHSQGPNDILEVKMPGGIGYVPALETHIESIDLENSRVLICEGALAESDL
ncbi:MAG: 16S rRNA processing protein RimM [Rhodobacterales bacterium]|nr:16S rRNA processing protein RimM [Rhodobacterales bacterium]